jgi:hypothetical protein
MGIISSIMSILKEISFSQFYFEIALMLRTAMLVNSMLFSIEKINSLTANNINLLEDCDKKLMRRIFQADQSLFI